MFPMQNSLSRRGRLSCGSLQPFEFVNQVHDSRFLCDGELAWDIEHPAPMIAPMLKVLSGDYHFEQGLPGV